MELFTYDRRVFYRQSGEVIKGWNSGVLDLDLEPDITICYLCDLG